jgi:hypothetical protein
MCQRVDTTQAIARGVALERQTSPYSVKRGRNSPNMVNPICFWWDRLLTARIERRARDRRTKAVTLSAADETEEMTCTIFFT